MPTIKVIIPAFNEEKSIAKVIAEIPDLVEEIVVVNNNSTDQTATVARKAGATVLTEKSKGYGYACLKGMDYLSQKDKTPDILVFLDGDFSDFPARAHKSYPAYHRRKCRFCRWGTCQRIKRKRITNTATSLW